MKYNMGDYASYIFIRYRKTNINKSDLSKIKEGIRDYNYIASLFIYFNKIEKADRYDEFYRNILDYDKEYLAVASPRGRSWFLISYVNKNILASRLEYEGVTFFNDFVFTVLEGLKGKFTVYRLIH